jgi:hypothetical protein
MENKIMNPKLQKTKMKQIKFIMMISNKIKNKVQTVIKC